MKRFFFGLLTGISVSAAAWFLATPSLTEKASHDAHEHGFTEGIAKGIEEGKAMQVKVYDSARAAEQKKMVVPDKKKAVVKSAPYKNPNDINYTVLGNQISAEIK